MASRSQFGALEVVIWPLDMLSWTSNVCHSYRYSIATAVGLGWRGHSNGTVSGTHKLVLAVLRGAQPWTRIEKVCGGGTPCLWL